MRTVLSAKLHGGHLTACNLDYEGSCGLGPDLLRASGILPLERVSVLNVSTGHRLETYVIAAKKNGEISLNGAAARYGAVGDKVIILAYAHLTEQELRSHKAQIVILDRNNKILCRRVQRIKL